MHRPDDPPPCRRLSRHQRVRKPALHRPSHRDRQLLATLATYPFLTAAQLCRLVFGGPSALSYCRDRLKRLYHAHLVDRLFVARALYGSPLTVYTLPRRRPSARSMLFLEHTLAVTDFIVAVHERCRSEWLVLDEVIQERELRRSPVRVDHEGHSVPVIPDAYLRLVLAGEYELAWCLELDRGTEPSRAVRRKIGRYLAFAAGPYQAAFGTTALTIVIVTTAGARRLATLIGAVEDELEAAGQEHQADLFRLTSADLTHESADTLLLTPRFWVPFQSEPVVLVPEVVP